MKITREIQLTEKERARLQLHSFLNVLNILHDELAAIRADLGQPDALHETTALIETALAAVKEGEVSTDLALQLTSANFYFSRETERAVATAPERDAKVDEEFANVASILNVMTVRLNEFFERQRTGWHWIPHSIDKLSRNFRQFFSAVEKNSHGRYHIIFDATAKGANDYLVRLDISGPGLSHHLLMPAVVQDVFRDLLANARKYTPPGGKITASLHQDYEHLELSVEDNGSGIDPEEIERTVEFGYRSTATQAHVTKGGGFGLTKAYMVARELDGEMFIDSEIDRGTRIMIRIPVPATGGSLARPTVTDSDQNQPPSLATATTT